MSVPEIWLPIAEFDGDYHVSSLGRVRSMHGRKGSKVGHIKATNETIDGYLWVDLYRDNAGHGRKVHTLVALTFFGRRPEGDIQIRHLDGNKHNNTIANLTYGTRSENSYDSIKHGTHAWASRTHCKNGHEFTPENTSKRSDCGGRRCLTCQRAWSAKRDAKAAQRAVNAIGGAA